MGGYADEFPLLAALGLYAAEIRGDGNCLFNSLSDQIYGHQDEHPAIRARVIEYMREHAAYYKQFLDVYPGGGTRRNPKRKSTGAYNSPLRFQPPSQEDIDRVFEQHLQIMAKGGTWGDNMEIQAFSSAFDIDVKIYQREFAYMIRASASDGLRPIAHIAYHTWEHYSSIRNLEGPHTGLPHVEVKPLTPQEEERQKQMLQEAPLVQPWMINVLQKSLQDPIDAQYAKEVLVQCNGNLDQALAKIMGLDDEASATSTQESSSAEPGPESDDDMFKARFKRQDRRLSRASRLLKLNAAHRGSHLAVPHTMSDNDGSQESLESFESEGLSSSEASQQSPSGTPFAHSDTIVLNTHSSPLREGTGRSSVRIKINSPQQPPPETAAYHGIMPRRQVSKRMSARDQRDWKKAAQKKARKERQQAAARTGLSPDPVKAGMELRSKGRTSTPVPILETLYI